MKDKTTSVGITRIGNRNLLHMESELGINSIEVNDYKLVSSSNGRTELIVSINLSGDIVDAQVGSIEMMEFDTKTKCTDAIMIGQGMFKEIIVTDPQNCVVAMITNEGELIEKDGFKVLCVPCKF